MPKDSKNLFFSPEIAASLGLEEAIIFNLICDSSVGIPQKNLNNELSFLQEKRFNDALSKLLALELIEEMDSKYILKNIINFIQMMVLIRDLLKKFMYQVFGRDTRRITRVLFIIEQNLMFPNLGKTKKFT